MSATETQPRGVFPLEDVPVPEKASQTLLSRIEVCPFSAGLYAKFKGEAQTHAMARGELFHAVVEQATNMLIEAGEPEMPPEVAKDLAQAMIEERVDLVLPADEQEAVRTCAWNWAASTFLDLEHLAAVETLFELEIGEWTIRGKIDLAEIYGNAGMVTDYKTSLKVRSHEEVLRGYQGQFYCLLLAEGHPEDGIALGEKLTDFTFRESYPRYRREEDGTLVAPTATYDRAALFDFKRSVEAQLAKLDYGLDTGLWAASPGSHCATCSAPQLCPIPESLRDIRSIGTAGEATEVMERVLFLDSESAALKKAGKEWAGENGAIQVGDYDWTFRLQESDKVRDKDSLRAFIEKHGEKWDTFYAKATSTRFDKRKRANDA